MPETAIIIPNLNGMEHLETCLRSLEHQTERDFQTFLVDNGSTDGSVEFVRTAFPAVTVIPFDTNRGFATAVNEGIGRSTSRYVGLINSDIELDPGWLRAMILGMENRPDVGAVACKMLNFFARDVIDAAGDVLTRSASASARGHGVKDYGQYDAEEFVFGPCAGAALYRRGMFEEIGLFDDDFFAFYEDVDMDFRMQMCGWKTAYVPRAICYHKRGATMERMYPLAVKLHVRNHIFYLVKNLPGEIFFRRLPLILGSRLRNWFLYSRSGYLGEVLRGVLEAVLAIPVMWARRKKIQRKRRVSIGYIESFMR